MPEHIRALIIILFLSFLVFTYIRKTRYLGIETVDFRNNSRIFYLISLSAFLSHNYWIHILLASLIVLIKVARDDNRLPLFMLLLFALPTEKVEIPGLGIINYLVHINHQQWLMIILFIPLILKQSVAHSDNRGRLTITDGLLLSYVALTILLSFREGSITESLRFAYYQTLNILLPYYVFSRFITNLKHFRDTLFYFTVACLILALIGFFEFAKHWHLYAELKNVLGLEDKFAYLTRDNLLRATASLDRIPLGYVMAIALGFYLVIQHGIKSRFYQRIGWGILFLGLLAPISRGPWVGALIIFITYLLTGKKPVQKTFLLVIGLTAFLSVASFLPYGDRVVQLIPFVGSTDEQNIDYRQRLIENSMIVIQDNLLLGSTDSEEYRLGRALTAVLVGVIAMIGTVSSVSVIPLMYWIVAAMANNYINNNEKPDET